MVMLSGQSAFSSTDAGVVADALAVGDALPVPGPLQAATSIRIASSAVKRRSCFIYLLLVRDFCADRSLDRCGPPWNSAGVGQRQARAESGANDTGWSRPATLPASGHEIITP
jgi:hypothetical protein